MDMRERMSLDIIVHCLHREKAGFVIINEGPGSGPNAVLHAARKLVGLRPVTTVTPSIYDTTIRKVSKCRDQ